MSTRQLIGVTVTAISMWLLWLHDWDYILDFHEAAIPKSDGLFFSLFFSAMLLIYGIVLLDTAWAHLIAALLFTVLGAYLGLNFEFSRRSPWTFVPVGIIWFIASVKALFAPKTVGRRRKPEPEPVIPSFSDLRKWLTLLSDRKNRE